MEFSEIREKFEGLTADQVCELAKFGKEILNHAGMFGLSSGLLNLIKDIINADDYVYNDNKCTIETLIHIISLVNDLTEKCWHERKTPFGLTGLKDDNEYLGLKDATRIEAL